MVSTFKTDAQGRHICPNCGDHYEPEYDSKKEAKANGTDAEKEQYITGLCSDECWDEYLGL